MVALLCKNIKSNSSNLKIYHITKKNATILLKKSIKIRGYATDCVA